MLFFSLVLVYYSLEEGKMRILSKKYFRKLCGGAVMFQVLLGLGLMVMMSPMIFSQIKKYNEEVQREEVVHHLEAWQKAASSFVIFEKDRPNAIQEGILFWEGGTLKNTLKDYMGNALVPDKNGFGQKYAMVTYRQGAQVEAVVIAYDGGVDRLTLNGIGQFLFDKGAIMDEEGNILSDLKLSNELTTALQGKVGAPLGSSGGGLLFMFVSDAFFTSDYLHIAPMPGSSDRASLVNTMIVDLNMGGFSIGRIKNFYANSLKASNAYVNDLSISDLELKTVATVKKDFEYQNVDGISGTELPVSTIDSEDLEESHKVEIQDMTVQNARFKNVKIEDGELETKDLKGRAFYVRGDVTVEKGWDNNLLVDNIVANTFSSADGSQVDEITNIKFDAPVSNAKGSEDSYLFVGNYQEEEGQEVYANDQAVILNLAGTSQVKDICYSYNGNSTCLSDEILNYYNGLSNLLGQYISAASARENKN